MITLGFNTIFDINQRKFKVQDTTNYSGQGVLLSNVKGVIKITTPRNVTYNNTNYSSPDITPSSSLFSGYISLPTNAQGYILAGTYIVEYSVLNSSDSSVSTLNQTYTYSFIVPEIVISQTVDGYNSTFTSTDNSAYGSYSSLTRTHEVTPPSGSPLSIVSNNNQIISYTPNIWSGIWTSQITSILVYIESDSLIINASLTSTETITAYLNDMNVIRGYIETFKQLYDQARSTNKELAYRIELSLNKINTSYVEYDLALFYNDLATAYLRTVDIITELSDYITIVFPEQIIPFVNSQGGSSHSPVSISTPNYGVSVNSSQVLSFSLATNSSGGMAPVLSGNATDYLGGDGLYHSLSSGTYALKSDFTAYSSVIAITSTNITEWQTAYSWGNHASAGYALSTNVYTKTELQTSGSSSVHWGNVTNKPTTLSGYGITDGMQGNASITASTHTKITYDSKGLITGGVDLSVSDIPSLPWSKITSGLPTTISGYGITDAYTKTEVDNKTWAWSSITSTPTTISGYGISDAYTKTEVNAKTWAWSTITSTPTTLSGYGITDGLSTSSPAASVINTGLGTMYLSDDGTYKVIDTSVHGSNTQLIYNNLGVYSGSNSMVFDGTTTTITTLLTSLLELSDTTTTITRDPSLNLVFTDVIAGTYTLAQLVGTATNFWTPSGNNIWYGYKVGIGGISTFTESLEVAGSILADNFSTKYFRHTSTDNLLIGVNSGNQETGSSKLYIHNNNSTIPLIYGDFSTLNFILGSNLTLRYEKGIIFGDANTKIYESDLGTGTQLFFKDALNTTALSLSDLRSGDYYSLISSFSDYTSVLSITTASKNIWDRSQYIILTGDGTKYLSDNGVYNTITGSLVVTDNILKWDTSTFRPYTTKSEAGGSLSNGKLYTDASSLPTATTTLVYDGTFHFTEIVTHSVSGVGVIANNITGNTSDIAKFQLNSVDQCVINSSGINLITGSTYKINGVEIGNFFQNGLINTGGVVTLGGDISTEVDITVTNSLLSIAGGIGSTGAYFFLQNDSGNIVEMGYSSTNSCAIQASNTGIAITYNSTSILFNDLGFTYGSDYSSTYTDRTLVDKGYISSIEPISNILYWNATSRYYSPYAASTAGCFDNSSTNPTNTTNRLNYNGILHSSKYILNSSVASDTAITVSMTGSGAIGVSVGVVSGIGLYAQASSGTGLQGSTTSGQAGVYGVSQNTATSGVLGASSSGSGISGLSFFGQAGYFKTYGTLTTNNSSVTIAVDRVHTGGTYNITGDVILITDNPTTSGTISGSLFKGVIGSTTRIDMNPRVVSGSGNYAYIFDTNSSLTAGGILRVLNFGTSLFTIGYNSIQSTLPITVTGTVGTTITGSVTSGTGVYGVATTGTGVWGVSDSSIGVRGASTSNVGLYGNSLSGNVLYLSQTGTPTSTISSSVVSVNRLHDSSSQNITGDIIGITDNPTSSGTISGSILKATIGSTIRIDMNPRVVDSSSAVSYSFDTANALSTAGAKIVSWKNNGTEKASITKDGYVYKYGTYAEIYVNNGTDTQSIPAGTTYTKITAFTTNGESSNCTSDQGNDKITVTKAGKYLVSFSFSTSISVNGITFRTALFVGGTEVNNMHVLRLISNQTGTSSSSVTGIINVSSANTDIDVRTYHDSGSAVLIQVIYGSLNVKYLGD